MSWDSAGCVPKASVETWEGAPSTQPVADGMAFGMWVLESRLWQRDGTLHFHHGLSYLLNFVPSTFEQSVKAKILKIHQGDACSRPRPSFAKHWDLIWGPSAMSLCGAQGGCEAGPRPSQTGHRRPGHLFSPCPGVLL